MAKILSLLVAASIFAAPFYATAEEAWNNQTDEVISDSDEINPFDPNIEKALEEFDQMYEEENGVAPFLENLMLPFGPGCYQRSCGVFAYVSLAEQRMYLYVDGHHYATYLVSSGAAGHGTPAFDTRPDGRIYNKYTSRKYPQGDYRGLGNMPYAVFIRGGFAIHGTTEGNFKYLGRRASHGCIRLHPDNAFVFNRLVRQYGIANTWITVQ